MVVDPMYVCRAETKTKTNIPLFRANILVEAVDAEDIVYTDIGTFQANSNMTILIFGQTQR
jgi:hypothetical protein